jgi:hypothetical protein
MASPSRPTSGRLPKSNCLPGEYDSLCDALQSLRQRPAETAAIREGLEDMQAGQFRNLDMVDAEIRQKHGFSQDA